MQTLARSRPVCCLLLIALQPGVLRAQTTPEPPRPRMNIVAVEGEAVVNNVRERKATNLVVIVRDGNRRPLSGAQVTFRLPESGPGGVFPNNAATTTSTTDRDGYAIVRGLRPNALPGPFRIEVEAKHQDETATASITQFNMEVDSAKGKSGKWVALAAVIGAAAAGGTVALTRNGARSTSPTPAAAIPIGISPGAGTVGPPR